MPLLQKSPFFYYGDKHRLVFIIIRIMVLIIVILSGIFGASCADCGPDPETETSVIKTLFITDSIGLAEGDSNYVFGAVYDIAIGPTGNIFVLDVGKCHVSVFSPEGEFIQHIARSGPGPGELNIPGFFTVLGDGSVYIVDANFVVKYSPEGELLAQKQTDMIDKPLWIQPIGSNDLLGVLSEYDIRDEGHFIVNRLSLWRDTTPEMPLVCFYEQEHNLSYGDFATNITRIDYFPMLFTGNNETVFLAPKPQTDPVIYSFDLSGTPCDTIFLSYEQVERTPDELSDEKVFIEQSVRINSFGQMLIDWEPDLYRPMIKAIGIGPDGNLWVQRGNQLTPVFDILDCHGTVLFTAVLPSRQDAIYWKFRITPQGIVAFSQDPEEYQVIYQFQLKL